MEPTIQYIGDVREGAGTWCNGRFVCLMNRKLRAYDERWAGEPNKKGSLLKDYVKAEVDGATGDCDPRRMPDRLAAGRVA